MLNASYPDYLVSRREAPNADLEVLGNYTGEVTTRVAMVDAEAIDRAIGAAEADAASMRQLRTYQRQAALDQCMRRFRERADELTMALCIEGTSDTSGSSRRPITQDL